MDTGPNREHTTLYKPRPEKKKEVNSLEQSKRKEDKRFAHDWKDKSRFVKKYLEWKSSFLNMMDKLTTICDGHSGRLIAVKLWI